MITPPTPPKKSIPTVADIIFPQQAPQKNSFGLSQKNDKLSETELPLQLTLNLNNSPLTKARHHM